MHVSTGTRIEPWRTASGQVESGLRRRGAERCRRAVRDASPFEIAPRGVDPIVTIAAGIEIASLGPQVGALGPAGWPGELDPIDDVFAPLGEGASPPGPADPTGLDQLLDRGQAVHARERRAHDGAVGIRCRVDGQEQRRVFPPRQHVADDQRA